jgi:hypothetical protein
MGASGRDFEGALGALLAANIREIGDRAAGRRRQVDFGERQTSVCEQVLKDRGQVVSFENFHVRGGGCLSSVAGRHDCAT